jgi:hypothetical protein
MDNMKMQSFRHRLGIYQENMDFSYSVSNFFDLLLLYESKVWNNHPPYNKMKNATLGEIVIINRYQIVKKSELQAFLL